MMYNWNANCILCNTNGCVYFANDYEGSTVLLVHSFTGISTCITSVTFILFDAGKVKLLSYKEEENFIYHVC